MSKSNSSKVYLVSSEMCCSTEGVAMYIVFHKYMCSHLTQCGMSESEGYSNIIQLHLLNGRGGKEV